MKNLIPLIFLLGGFSASAFAELKETYTLTLQGGYSNNIGSSAAVPDGVPTYASLFEPSFSSKAQWGEFEDWIFALKTNSDLTKYLRKGSGLSYTAEVSPEYTIWFFDGGLENKFALKVLRQGDLAPNDSAISGAMQKSDLGYVPPSIAMQFNNAERWEFVRNYYLLSNFTKTRTSYSSSTQYDSLLNWNGGLAFNFLDVIDIEATAGFERLDSNAVETSYRGPNFNLALNLVAGKSFTLGTTISLQKKRFFGVDPPSDRAWTLAANPSYSLTDSFAFLGTFTFSRTISANTLNNNTSLRGQGGVEIKF